jgi:hypothetical protein
LGRARGMFAVWQCVVPRGGVKTFQKRLCRCSGGQTAGRRAPLGTAASVTL